MATWTDSLAIGIPLIDMQHKQLLDQLDTLANALNAGKGDQELKSILKFLDMYVMQHFGYEEACMHRHHCPVAQLNDNAHELFQKKIQLVKEDIEKKGGNARSAMRVQQELSSWFVSHIQMIDHRLKQSMAT